MNPWTLSMATSQEHVRDLRRGTCHRSLAAEARCALTACAPKRTRRRG